MTRLYHLSLNYVFWIFAIASATIPEIGYPQNTSTVDSLEAAFRSASSDSARVFILLEQTNILIYEDTGKASIVIRNAIDLSRKASLKELLVRCYHRQAELYYQTGQYEKCIQQYEIGLSLAKDINFAYGISEALLGLGNVYQIKSDYEKAKKYHFENITFCEKIGDLDGVASSFNNLGNIANDLGDYSGGIEYYTKSAKLYDQIGNELSSAILMSNIGMIQNKLKDYDRAIPYFEQSNIIFRKLNYKPGINFVLKNLGVSYKNKGELDKALKVYREALVYYTEAGVGRQRSELHLNIGNLYWEKGKYDSARLEYFKTLDIASVTGDSAMLARVHNTIGSYYYLAKDFVKSKTHLLKGKQIARRIHNPLLRMTSEQELRLTYAALGDYRNAYESYSNFSLINDSLQSVEKNKLAKEIEAKYQNEKKEKEIALLSAQNEMSNLQIKKRENERVYLFSLALFSAVLGLVMYRLFKIKQKANKKLQKLNQLQSNFFTNVSHEFRTPLTLILAALEDKMDKGSKGNNNEIIERNTRRLLQLINQLLDLSRLEAGNEKLQVQQLRVSAFLRTLANSFSSLAESKSVTFHIDIPDSTIAGYLDTDKIEKIIFNLLSNAFKFTPPKGKVTIRGRITEKRLILEIMDNGIGIPSESIDQIFQRFYRINSADNRDYEGTGIGLALTKELVELHQGNIIVNSEENNGSVFTITIPLAGYNKEFIMEQAEGESAFVPALTSEDLPVTGKRPEETNKPITTIHNDFVVLVVEDNADLLNYLNQSLNREYVVLTASNGQQGYEMAVEHIPDLVISDLMMPKMDGREMCLQIRHNEKTSHIPFIMLTAKADRESKLEGLESGADDYLTKPFDSKELKIRIRNMLLQRDKLQEHVKSQFLFPDSNLPSDDKFIKKASEIIYANLANTDFSIEEFHREMGYSRMQLHRKIKAISGQSANDFIRLIRLKKAAVLLEKGHDQIAQIAYETGFSSPSYFAKCFKEAYGVTPGEYAEKASS